MWSEANEEVARAEGATLKYLDGAPLRCTCSKSSRVLQSDVVGTGEASTPAPSRYTCSPSSWVHPMICYGWSWGDLHLHCQSLTSYLFFSFLVPICSGNAN